VSFYVNLTTTRYDFALQNLSDGGELVGRPGPRQVYVNDYKAIYLGNPALYEGGAVLFNGGGEPVFAFASPITAKGLIGGDIDVSSATNLFDPTCNGPVYFVNLPGIGYIAAETNYTIESAHVPLSLSEEQLLANIFGMSEYQTRPCIS
jgi:hypothetical protein